MKNTFPSVVVSWLTLVSVAVVGGTALAEFKGPTSGPDAD